jgi:hypothetical protein
MCIARFDQDTKIAFSDLYSKIDPTIIPKEVPVVAAPAAPAEAAF